MNGINHPETTLRMRLVSIVGIVCAVVTCIAFTIGAVLRLTNSRSAEHIFSDTAGLLVFINMLLAFTCGIILRKKRPVIGMILIGLMLLIFIVALAFPELGN
jgi:hypothetical protein